MPRHCKTLKHTKCQSGEGRILDTVKSGLSLAKKGLAKIGIQPRLDSFNNFSQRIISQYGNVPITKISIYRTPIHGIIDKLINIVSLGKWNQMKKKLAYDKVFHLALIVNFASGKQMVLEKNEVINVGGPYTRNSQTQIVDVPLKGAHTISSLLENARRKMGDGPFFSYSAFSSNCQDFVQNLLSASGLLTPTAEKFIKQDVSDLVKQSEHTKVLADTITYTAATANKLMGKGNQIATKRAMIKIYPKKRPEMSNC